MTSHRRPIPPPARVRPRTLLATIALATLSTACGAAELVSELADDVGESSEPTAPDEPAEDGTAAEAADDGDGGTSDPAEGPGFGSVLAGEVVLSGVVEARYDADDPDTAIRMAGGCQRTTDPYFGVQLQVLDLTDESVTGDPGVVALDLTTTVPEDLGGGVTGTFTPEALTVSVFDPPGDVDSRRQFRRANAPQLEVTRHDAPDTLEARRMHVTLAAEGMTSGPGGTDEGELDVRADIEWVMGCT